MHEKRSVTFLLTYRPYRATEFGAVEGATEWLRQIVYGNPLFIFGGLGMALRGSHALSFLGGTQRIQFETAINSKV